MQKSGLENDVDVAYFQYDEKKHGGAVGDNLVGGDAIPKGAVIRRGVLDINEAATSTATGCTIGISAVSVGDILGQTAVASFAKDVLLDIVPVNTAATSIRATSDIKSIKVTPAVGALTAGKFTVALQYLRPR